VSRRALLRLAQVVVAALVLWYVGRALARAWQDYQANALDLHVAWGPVLASGLVFLGTYAVLIETWRAVVRQWGERLSFLDAARIWTVSSLTRYLPGKLWQIPLMGRMAQQRGVSPIAAAGAAVIGTVVNIAAGFVVALALAPSLLEAARPGAARAGLALAIVGVLGLVALPWVLPHLLRLAARVIRRPLDVGALPMRAIVVALAGNLVAWFLYGWAFRLFALGIVGQAPGRLVDWVAAWAISYVIGYIVLILPAGVGAREGALYTVLPAAGLAVPSQAIVIAVASRLWLTILEIVPGLVFLASGALRRREPIVGPPKHPR